MISGYKHTFPTQINFHVLFIMFCSHFFNLSLFLSFFYLFLSIRIRYGYKKNLGSTTDATELPAWNLRFDVRMLATQWKWSAEIPWNSFILTTKKSGLQTNQHVTLLSGRAHRSRMDPELKTFATRAEQRRKTKQKNTHKHTVSY